MNDQFIIWIPCIAMAVEACKKISWIDGHKDIYSLLSVGFGMLVSVSLGGSVVDGLALGLTACGGYSLVKKAAE